MLFTVIAVLSVSTMVFALDTPNGGDMKVLGRVVH